MEDTIRLKRITDPDDSLISKLEKIYHEAFPEGERRPWSVVTKLAETNNDFYLCAALDQESVPGEDKVIGILIYWDLFDFIFGDYLATAPVERNSGYGARIMKTLQMDLSKPIILEVEPPENELSSRRIAFYKRLGFHLSDHPYFMPDFANEKDTILMHLMSYPHPLKESDAEKATNVIHRRIYNLNPSKKG